MDRWESLPIVCKGGIHQELDVLTLGTTQPGAATILTNYEPSIAGGYARIEGYSKWDSTTVPGNSTAPILGVCAALGGVFAARFNTSTSSNDIFFSSGSGWTKINTSTRPGGVTKMRIINYALSALSIIITDGINPAAKWDGTTYTVINGTGAPTAPKYIEAMPTFVALAQGNQLYISAPNSDTDFNGADGAVQINMGDTITGLYRFRDTLYIFCTTSIFELSGTDNSNFMLDAVTKSIGCVSGDTIQEVGGDLIYLAPDGFRSLAATYRISDLQLGLLSRPISPILLDNSFTTGGFNENSYNSMQIHAKNQYRCWVYDSSVPKIQAFGVLGKRTDDPINVIYEWGTLQGIQPYCCYSEYENQREVSVIGDPKNGFVYRMESGNDFDGTAVPYNYRSPDLTFSDATLRKVMQKATIYTQATGDMNVLLNVQLDVQDSASLQPPSINLNAAGGQAVYGTAVYDTAVYSVISNPVFKIQIIGSGFLIAFQFSGQDSNAPHRIDSFQIEYAQKGRR